MSNVITGLFDSPAKASAAIETLVARGVGAKDITIVANDDIDKESFAIDSHTKLPEGVALGATAGGAATALAAGLTAAGTVASGGAGLLVAGPLVASLAGAGAGAAAGGIIGGAIGAALPEHEVKHYEEAVEKGSILIGATYEDSDQKSMIQNTFKFFDAEKVSSA